MDPRSVLLLQLWHGPSLIAEGKLDREDDVVRQLRAIEEIFVIACEGIRSIAGESACPGEGDDMRRRFRLFCEQLLKISCG
jgi:hypothetical protein